METRLVLIDGHGLILNGIRMILAPHAHYHIAGQAKNGLDAYALCREERPDIVILELDLPGMDGLDVIAQLHRRWPAMRILVLTSRGHELHAASALRQGASGYVLKKSSQQTLLSGLQCVAAGKRYIDPLLDSGQVLQQIDIGDVKIPLLTLRERQVLKQIAEGASNPVIADKLSISRKTVETHRLNMMKKLNVHKATELIRWSQRYGMMEP
ncbi:two component system response regulator [Biostraticola tofi]|nr:two component system response regulator [Biostraticola tofi]